MNHAQILVIVYLTLMPVVSLFRHGEKVSVSFWSGLGVLGFWLYVLYANDFWSVS